MKYEIIRVVIHDLLIALQMGSELISNSELIHCGDPRILCLAHTNIYLYTKSANYPTSSSYMSRTGHALLVVILFIEYAVEHMWPSQRKLFNGSALWQTLQG